MDFSFKDFLDYCNLQNFKYSPCVRDKYIIDVNVVVKT